MDDEAEHAAAPLVGAWRSTEAFGNTSLDWSQALKDQKASLVVEFREDASYSFRIYSREDPSAELTSEFRHIVAADGVYATEDNRIHIKGDTSGIQWTFQREEDNTLRIRLEGAKRFGRCKGVDVIYFVKENSSKTTKD